MDSFDVVVIGSGPGGYVAAIRAAQLGLKTACIEKSPVLGGTCLNVGCIPSKTFLHSSELYWKLLHEGKEQGIEISSASFNFKQLMDRKTKVVRSFNEGVAFLFKKNRITSFTGQARLKTPNLISIDGSKEIEAKSIILATGSEPIPLSFLPFDEKRIVSSTGALVLSKVPKKLLVVGAGVIGVELGSVYKRLGAEVTFIEFLDRICYSMDENISTGLLDIFTQQGMTFLLSSKVVSGEVKGDQVVLKVAKSDQSVVQMEGDIALICIGRRPYTKDLGLEAVGITPNEKGFIPIDGSFRTKVPNIYAIGDVVDGPMLAHKASEEGVAAAEIIAGQQPHVDYMSVPNVIYTYPEAASVGLTEADAKKLSLSVKIGHFPFKVNSRAKCTGEEDGFVKIIADEKSDRVVGVHIMGAHASELIAEAMAVIAGRMTALQVAEMPNAHPTFSEAIKEAALAVHKRTINR